MSKKTQKILMIILIFQFFCFLFLVSPAKAASAFNPTMPHLQIPIPDLKFPGKFLEFTKPKCTGEKDNQVCEIWWIAEYISAIYKYAIGIIGILATVVMMIGGLIWLTAGGNATRIGEAKAWIGASVAGLVIALCSYMILYQINPELVKLKPIKIGIVKELDDLQRQYSSSCPTENEQKNGYTAFTTGYCKPQWSASDISVSGYFITMNFLCRVGLNCTCPDGQYTNDGPTCGQSYKWFPCKPFPVFQPYCDKTAAGGKPKAGQVAADWNCAGINKNSSLCINGTTYQVTDQGGAIKGKRIDMFVDDCAKAGSVTGEKFVKIGGCSK